MDYQETLNWMFTQLPMYQNIGGAAYKVDLSNSIRLSEHLKFPENRFKSIHVAGTNGKGSTSHMIASVLQQAGYKVGLYTSPHLKDYSERIKINGVSIPKEYVVNFVDENKSFFEEDHYSFFEMTVGLAFDYFSKQEIDIAVIEVGLGGRLDSTNILNPILSVITNIGLDHTQILGNTLQEIAYEKAGIIKSETPVVIGEYQEQVHSVFYNRAKELNTSLTLAEKNIEKVYNCDLKGVYQKKNVKTAVQTLELLNTLGFQVDDSQIKKGLESVVKNTKLLGRWQILQSNPQVICDTAHNKEGLSIVLNQIQKIDYQNLHIILGVVNDKELDNVLCLFPKKARYYFAKPNIPRGLEVDKLKKAALAYGLLGESYNSVGKALKFAKDNANQADLIFVGGSTFVVAEVI